MPLSPFDPTQDYQAPPTPVADTGTDPDQQDAVREATRFLVEQLRARPAAPDPEAEAQTAETRLNRLLGPPPTQPHLAGKWDKIAAAFQDVGSAAGQIWQGFHPTTGTGRRRRVWTEGERVQPTHALAAQSTEDEALRQRYEQAQAHRGLIAAQMLPSYLRQSETPEERARNRSMQAAASLITGQQRVDAATLRGQHHDKAVASLANMFIGPDGKVARDDSTLDHLFMKRYGTMMGVKDPDELSAALLEAKGTAEASSASIAAKGSYAGLTAQRLEDLLKQYSGGGAGQRTSRDKDIRDYVAAKMKAWAENPLNKYTSAQDPAKSQAAAAQFMQEASTIFGGGGGESDQSGQEIIPSGITDSDAYIDQHAHEILDQIKHAARGGRPAPASPTQPSPAPAGGLAAGTSPPTGGATAGAGFVQPPAAAAGIPATHDLGADRQRNAASVRAMTTVLKNRDYPAMRRVLEQFGHDSSEFDHERGPDGQPARERTPAETQHAIEAAFRAALKAVVTGLRGAQQGAIQP